MSLFNVNLSLEHANLNIDMQTLSSISSLNTFDIKVAVEVELQVAL